MIFDIILIFSVLFPSIVLGMVLGLFSWFVLHLVEKLLNRKFLNSNFLVIGSAGVVSFLIVVMLYTYSIINFTYQLSIPSSPIAVEKQMFQKDVVAEAFQRSILPPTFQQPCVKKPEIVCELAEVFSWNLWDTNITYHYLPLLAGIMSAVINIFSLLFGDFIFSKPQAGTIPQD